MPGIDSNTDEELVSLVLKNKDFFTFIIHRYEAKLARYIKRLGVFVPEDTEDLLQTIFIKVYKSLNGFDNSLKFSSWIYRIAHNETMSYFRARKIRPEGNAVFDSEKILPFLFDDTDSSKEAELRIDGEHINIAMESLEDKYREVIILRYFEEKDYEEISDILRIPSGSVATLIHRAKKQLKEKLAHLE